MADINRTLMGPKSDGTSGLFISKPTFDVITASAANLIFDSRLGHYGSVIVSGTASAGSTISFPSTLPYIPMAYVFLINGGSIATESGDSYTVTTDDTNINVREERKRQVKFPSYTVSTTALTILSNASWYLESGSPATSYTCRYIVWRMPGG